MRYKSRHHSRQYATEWCHRYADNWISIKVAVDASNTPNGVAAFQLYSWISKTHSHYFQNLQTCLQFPNGHSTSIVVTTCFIKNKDWQKKVDWSISKPSIWMHRQLPALCVDRWSVKTVSDLYISWHKYLVNCVMSPPVVRIYPFKFQRHCGLASG